MNRRGNTNKNRFMGWISGYEKRITQTAELAQISHDPDTLMRIASLGLGPLSLFAESVGLCQQGNVARAEQKARELIEQGPSGFKARAMVLLASNKWETNPDEALAMYERARVLTDDPSTALTITKMRAVVWSSLGDHTRALHMLGDGVSLLARIHNPPLCADFLNSLAVESIHVGRFNQARQLCQITTSSPYAALFPQWMETASGLWADKRGRKMSVNVPQQKADVLPFTSLREPPGISTRLLRARAVAVVSAISDTRLLACIARLGSLHGPNLELFIRTSEIDPDLAQIFLQQIDKHDSLLAERTGVSEN